jgi:hypothetical protein
MKCMSKHCDRPVERPTDVFRTSGTPRIYCRQHTACEHQTRWAEQAWWAHVGDCSCGNRIFVSPSIRTGRYPPKWFAEKQFDCGRCVSPDDLDADYRQEKAAERARQDADINALWPESEAYR